MCWFSYQRRRRMTHLLTYLLMHSVTHGHAHVTSFTFAYYYYYYYNHFMALWTLSQTTRVSQYQGEPVPESTFHHLDFMVQNEDNTGVTQKNILGCGEWGWTTYWPTNLNSSEIFVQCTYPPSFIFLCLIVWKLPCWQTNKQMPLKITKIYLVMLWLFW